MRRGRTLAPSLGQPVVVRREAREVPAVELLVHLDDLGTGPPLERPTPWPIAAIASARSGDSLAGRLASRTAKRPGIPGSMPRIACANEG